MTPDHPRELLSGYVLGDLEQPQLERLETHLLACSACRAEVGRLQDALYSLAQDLPPGAPPPRSWERLQARQLPAPTPTPDPTPAPPRSARRPLARQRGRAWLLAKKALAARLLVTGVCGLLMLGGYAAWREFSVPSLQAQVQQWRRQGAVQLALKTRLGEEFGTLLVRPDEQCLIVLKQRPPAGQVYQVWGRRESGPHAGVPISLGLTDGQRIQVYYGEFDSMGVSLEPLGGSPLPTHPLGRVNLPKG